MGANNREGTHSIRSRVGLLAAALVIVATACACQQTSARTDDVRALPVVRSHDVLP